MVDGILVLRSEHPALMLQTLGTGDTRRAWSGVKILQDRAQGVHYQVQKLER